MVHGEGRWSAISNARSRDSSDEKDICTTSEALSLRLWTRTGTPAREHLGTRAQMGGR